MVAESIHQERQRFRHQSDHFREDEDRAFTKKLERALAPGGDLDG